MRLGRRADVGERVPLAKRWVSALETSVNVAQRIVLRTETKDTTLTYLEAVQDCWFFPWSIVEVSY